jgi:hypothetical protein
LRAVQAAQQQATSLRQVTDDGWFANAEDLIFSDDDGRTLHESRGSRAWRMMLAEYNLPATRPHDLRHSAAESR